MNLVFFISMTTILLFSVNLFASESSPVEIDTNILHEGILLTIQLNNMPINIIYRRENEIISLQNTHSSELSPVSNCSECDPVLRSISTKILVTWGYNLDTGCKLIYISSRADDWKDYKIHEKGGFIDKCNMSQYDLSGRLIDGSANSSAVLSIPNYEINSGIITFNKNEL